MLSFPKGGLKGSAEDIVRYVEDRVLELQADGKKGSRHGYYSGRGAPSEWGGALAAAMGLSGPVDPKILKDLLEGRAPDGTAFAKKSRKRRMAKDLTWSAPKSCSIAANAGDERLRRLLLEGHDRAVRRSMRFVEERYVTARYGKGGKEVERTGQALWSAFRHEESRAADGVATMQIHTHGLLLNVTKGRNGELRALDIDFGQDGVKLAGAVYQSEYAAFLREHGVALRQAENGAGGWELACITDDQITECSPRSAQIVAELAKQGLDRKTATAQQKVAANLATRESKSGQSEDELRWEWRALCRDLNVDVSNAYKTPDQDLTPDPEQEPVATAADSLRYATDHLSERESVINEQSTLLHALRHRPLGGVTIDNLTAEVDAARDAGALIDAGVGRLVTRETLEREAYNLSTVAAGRATLPPLTDEAGALARIEERERINGFTFSAGQRQAVADALTTSDQFWGIRGAAGAGKSTALAALADEARARGFRVIGTGPSQTAADGTADAAPDDARVLASFVMREEKDEVPRLILLDEAGMVSSRDMEAFLQKVRPQDRVVFIGDPRQLAAVEAGSPFAQMMKEKVIGFSEITEINRQKDPALLAVAQAFADGRNADAVKLAEPFMTAVTVTDEDYQAAKVAPEPAAQQQDVPEATEEMVLYVGKLRDKAADQGQDLPPLTATDFRTVRAWLDEHAPKRLGLDDEKSAHKLAPQAVRVQAIARETAQAYLELSQDERDKTLVLAATNEMRRAINEKVKAGLQEQVPEGTDVASVTVTALDKSQCTRAKRREAINYKEGMILRVPEGRGRAKTIVDWAITATDPTRNTVTARNREGEEKVFKPRDLNPKEVGLYTKRDLALDVGDRVVFTENRRGDGYQNNETGTVVSVDADKVRIKKDNGKEVELAAAAMHAVDHGWAVTVHRSQGRTIDRAFVAGMASKMATAALAYVACTRERLHLHIFTDHIKRLQQSWARVADRETAKDAVERAAAAQETAPLAAAREAVRAQVQEQQERAKQEQESEQEPEAKPEPAPRWQREQDLELEM
ncbi:MobF family relaxase [Acidiferrobacter sp.]|uniref:MobF family relaxase n=1 Tax=Acidiferrobacter sp. TaxID=1872107 RepID=UPI00263168F8|nr:MobF family relaxase [Acidiferrobacter sp.]